MGRWTVRRGTQGQLIKKVTLHDNGTLQTAITKELMDIVAMPKR